MWNCNIERQVRYFRLNDTLDANATSGRRREINVFNTHMEFISQINNNTDVDFLERGNRGIKIKYTGENQ